MSELEVKDALKEALKEWLDEKFTQFGKFSAYTLGAGFLAVLIYLMLITNGWHRGS